MSKRHQAPFKQVSLWNSSSKILNSRVSFCKCFWVVRFVQLNAKHFLLASFLASIQSLRGFENSKNPSNCCLYSDKELFQLNIISWQSVVQKTAAYLFIRYAAVEPSPFRGQNTLSQQQPIGLILKR